MAKSSRSFNNITRQIAREEILNNQRRGSFKSYMLVTLQKQLKVCYILYLGYEVMRSYMYGT